MRLGHAVLPAHLTLSLVGTMISLKAVPGAMVIWGSSPAAASTGSRILALPSTVSKDTGAGNAHTAGCSPSWCSINQAAADHT